LFPVQKTAQQELRVFLLDLRTKLLADFDLDLATSTTLRALDDQISGLYGGATVASHAKRRGLEGENSGEDGFGVKISGEVGI
jgi:hypothetical protein